MSAFDAPNAAAAPSPPGWTTPAELRLEARFKEVPEDFEVDEIPAYVPSGEGEHLYLWIEKRDISHDFLLGHLARTLGCRRDDIGAAGIKDRRAVTRQWVSVPARGAEPLSRAETESIHILSAVRHGHKLRTGKLRGNRFRIRLRGMPEGLDLAGTAVRIAEHVEQRGVPNLYGDQRFGLDQETLRLGLGLLRGERRPGDIPHAKRRFLLRLACSSVQSAVFNAVLADRLADGLLATVLEGDVMQVSASGGVFVVEDVAAEQARCDAREIEITGPLPGPEMKPPTGQAARREAAVLERLGLTATHFEQFARLTPGARRPLRLRPEALSVEPDGLDVVLSFELPAGAYATSVLREFLKTCQVEPPAV